MQAVRSSSQRIGRTLMCHVCMYEYRMCFRPVKTEHHPDALCMAWRYASVTCVVHVRSTYVQIRNSSTHFADHHNLRISCNTPESNSDQNFTSQHECYIPHPAIITNVTFICHASASHQIPIYATGHTITHQGFKLWSSL